MEKDWRFLYKNILRYEKKKRVIKIINGYAAVETDNK
jgi:hypothetical protein